MADYDFNVSEKDKRKVDAPVEFAGIGQRFVAAVIDGIITQIIAGLLGGIVGFILGITSGATTTAELEALQQQAQAIGFIIGLIVGLVYFVYIPPNWEGKTVGKNVMNIRIIKADGSNVTYGTMFIRDFIGKLLSTITFLIGYLIAFGDDEKRTLHDRLANTRVIKA